MTEITELREKLKAALSDVIGEDAYDCIRVWEAWSVGTMTEDDFWPVTERIDEIVDAVMSALPTRPEAVVRALQDIRRAITEDATALNDTLWMPDDVFKGGTVVDFIDHTISALSAPAIEADGWLPIDTCPFRTPVDLWCIYGGEEFAQYDGGASIGTLISSRHKTQEYGFFGNQSNDGVPRGHAPDLKPVAWRPAVPQCPSALIAEVLGIPLTREDAIAASTPEKSP